MAARAGSRSLGSGVRGGGAWRVAFASALQEGWERGLVMLNFACAYNVVTNHVVEVTVCMGPSMLPTLNAAGDIVLLEHVTQRTSGIRNGDVVVAKSPVDPKMTVCKRVTAVAGDTVTIPSMSLLERPRKFKVPEGHVWLQGDNLQNSTDSRHYGPVPAALVKGRVFYRVWPPRAWGPVERR